jgi:hypothetical protein
MLKYVDTQVTFAEIPDEITLCINLSNCPCHCKDCHSDYLAGDIGEVLTITRIEKLLEENKGVTAICFMGGDNDPKLVNHYASLIKQSVIAVPSFLNDGLDGPQIQLIDYTPNPIKVGWYSGRQELAKEINLWNFDYIKLGPYNEELGPLNSRTTNQRFYKVFHTSMGVSKLMDYTSKFWKSND